VIVADGGGSGGIGERSRPEPTSTPAGCDVAAVEYEGGGSDVLDPPASA